MGRIKGRRRGGSLDFRIATRKKRRRS